MSLNSAHSIDNDETVSSGSMPSISLNKEQRDSIASTDSFLSTTERDFLKKEQRDSISPNTSVLSSLTRELQDLRKEVYERIRCESDQRFAQVEVLGRCLEEERTVRSLKLQEQDDRISELESSHEHLVSEQIDFELVLNKHKVKEVRSQIDALIRRSEVHDNELRELTQRFEETSGCSQLDELMQRLEAHIAETERKHIEFESEHMLDTNIIEAQDDHISELKSTQKRLVLEQAAQSALCKREIEGLRLQIGSLSRNAQVHEVIKMCQKNNEWCSQLDELTQRLETRSAEHNQYLELHHMVGAPVNSELQDLRAAFDARIQDLTSSLDAERADCKEKQEEQNQAEISVMTLTTTLASRAIGSYPTHAQQLVVRLGWWIRTY